MSNLQKYLKKQGLSRVVSRAGRANRVISVPHTQEYPGLHNIPTNYYLSRDIETG